MNTAQRHRIQPSDVSTDTVRQLEALVKDRRRPALVGSTGERIELPEALTDVLRYVIEAMKRNQAVFVLPEDAALTTQQAADLMGISRPYLLRLLDAGSIPYHRVGTHRRIMLQDVRACQATRDAERRARLDRLSAVVGDAGVYDRC